MKSVWSRLLRLVAFPALFSPSLSFAGVDPYATVVAATAVNMCMVRHGYINSEEAAQYLIDYASSEGISPRQVSNIMELPSFWKTTERAIEGQGGCSSIVATILGKTRKTTRSLASEDKPNVKLMYEAIDSASFVLDQPYQPNMKKYLK